MTIDTQDILRYIEAQKQIFKNFPTEFSNGIIEGMNLVKAFVSHYEYMEGNAIDSSLNKKEGV